MEYRRYTYIGTEIMVINHIPIEVKRWTKDPEELNLIISTHNSTLRSLYLTSFPKDVTIEFLMRDLDSLSPSEYYEDNPVLRYIYVNSLNGSVDKYLFFTDRDMESLITKPKYKRDFDLVKDLREKGELHHSGKFKIAR
jgi:hypothetical protein